MRFPCASLGLLLALVTTFQASAQPQPWPADGPLNDPDWQQRFLGSYGFLSGAEPEIAPSELELLREVIELMKANPRAAAARLEGAVGEASSAALDFVLANLQFQTGELEPAMTHYRSALEKFPDFRRAHKNLGLLLVQQRDCAAALKHLSRAVELGDRDGRNLGLMGYCYINLENYLAAEQAYRNAILQQPDVRDWKDGLARSLLAMEKYKEAAALFGSLIDEDPEDARAWLLQANAFIGLERPEAAAVNLEAVRMLGKADLGSLVLLGDIYMNAGIPELAKGVYLEAIEKDSGTAQYQAAYRAAELLLRARAFSEAGEILDSIEARYADNLSKDDRLEVLTLKAKLARAEGRSREAADLLESIVRQDGTRGDALLELASYYHEAGDADRALLLVERAQRLTDYRYQALLEHAQLLVSTRDYEGAAERLREALELKSEPRVTQFLARVEQAARR